MTIRQELTQATVTSAHGDFNHRKFDRLSMAQILDLALTQLLERDSDYFDYWQSLTDLSRQQLRTRIMMQYFEQAPDPD